MTLKFDVTRSPSGRQRRWFRCLNCDRRVESADDVLDDHILHGAPAWKLLALEAGYMRLGLGKSKAFPDKSGKKSLKVGARDGAEATPFELTASFLIYKSRTGLL
jgi:hypothetical protein